MRRLVRRDRGTVSDGAVVFFAICMCLCLVLEGHTSYRDGRKRGFEEGYEKCLNDHGMATITTVIRTEK